MRLSLTCSGRNTADLRARWRARGDDGVACGRIWLWAAAAELEIEDRRMRAQKERQQGGQVASQTDALKELERMIGHD